MYKRLSAVMFPIVTLVLVGAVLWGYQENQEKNAILIKAENQYQRAFHDLSFHVDKLQNELGNTLAVSSASTNMHRKSLMNVWRITSEAQSEINQLPLTLLPFNETEDFLSRISKLSYQTAMRDLTKQPLTDNEVKNLNALYKNAVQIREDLAGVQSKVIKDRLRWMDVETALATEDLSQDNSIIDGFKTVNKKVSEYPEMDWGPSIASIYNKRSVKKLGGHPITIDEVKSKAATFVDGGVQAKDVKVTENGKGTEWESYTATVAGKGNGESHSLDYTRNGGHLIGYYNSRDIGDKTVSSDVARQHADQFLKSKGYPNLVPVTYDEHDNIGNFTYVMKQGDVLIYPEKITVRVGLDNGGVTGLQASDYVYEQEEGLKTNKPKLSLAEARKYLNTNYKETYNRLALIENELMDKVLTYEFGGSVNGSKYRIFINADNGNEEMIEQIRETKKPAAS